MEKFQFLKEHNSTQHSPITFPFRKETLRIVSKNQAFSAFLLNVDWLRKTSLEKLAESTFWWQGKSAKLWKNRSRSRSCPPRQDGYRCKAAFAGFRALKASCGWDRKVRDVSHAKKLKNSIQLGKKEDRAVERPHSWVWCRRSPIQIGCHHLTCRSTDLLRPPCLDQCGLTPR